MKEIAIGLICTMGANILLGTTIGTFNDSFDWKTFLKGIIKSLSEIGGCILLYICAYYNPDIVIANVNGNDVNLMESMKILFVSGIIMYGIKDLVKLKDLLGVSVKIDKSLEKAMLSNKDKIEVAVANNIKEITQNANN